MSAPLETSEKISLLGVICNLAEQESDRTWARYTFMIAVHSAAAALMFQLDNMHLFLASLCVCGVGFYLTFVWRHIREMSKFYERRWHLDFDALVNRDLALAEWLKARSANPRMKRPPGKSTTDYVDDLTELVLLVWICFAAYNFYALVTHPEFDRIVSLISSINI